MRAPAELGRVRAILVGIPDVVRRLGKLARSGECLVGFGGVAEGGEVDAVGHRADGSGGEGEDADEKTDGDAPAVNGDATRFPAAGQQLEPLEVFRESGTIGTGIARDARGAKRNADDERPRSTGWTRLATRGATSARRM